MGSYSKQQIIFHAIQGLDKDEFTTNEIIDFLMDKKYKNTPRTKELSQLLNTSILIQKVGITKCGCNIWAMK